MFWLFFRTLEDDADETRQHVNELCKDDAVFLRLLRSALGEMQTQSMGDVYVSYAAASLGRARRDGRQHGAAGATRDRARREHRPLRTRRANTPRS